MNATNKRTIETFKQFMQMFENEPKAQTAAKEIDKLLADKQIIMVFKFPKKKIRDLEPKFYGTTEANRIAFVKMSDPNKEDMGAIDSFQAFDLEHLIKNSNKPDDFQQMKIFDKDDIKNLEIIKEPSRIAKDLAHLVGKQGIETTKSKKTNMLFKDNPND